MFDLGDNNELLKTDGTAVPNFYVDTDTTSVEYGNIYYSCTIDGEATKLYGFSVEPDDSESYDVDESQGYLWQTGMLYYYSNDEKVYYGESSEETLDGELVTTVNYYYMDSSYNLVLPTDGSTPSASQVNGSDLIALVVTEGSINSYGPLSINSYGEMYATGDIRAWGKTIISNKAVVYTKGDFVCTKIISLSSLLDSASTGVCGFEFRHAALHADGDIRLYSCTEIEGGTIDAVGDIIFDGIYNEYQYEYVDSTTTPYTDPTKVDLWICSESGNVDFNCIFNSLGGVTYAPNGKITMDGIYFEHYGCLIAGDNDINAFYVNVHRLPNSDTVDIQWTQPGNVYLCTPMDE
jgi:hypothetical protein